MWGDDITSTWKLTISFIPSTLACVYIVIVVSVTENKELGICEWVGVSQFIFTARYPQTHTHTHTRSWISTSCSESDSRVSKGFSWQRNNVTWNRLNSGSRVFAHGIVCYYYYPTKIRRTLTTSPHCGRVRAPFQRPVHVTPKH